MATDNRTKQTKSQQVQDISGNLGRDCSIISSAHVQTRPAISEDDAFLCQEMSLAQVKSVNFVHHTFLRVPSVTVRFDLMSECFCSLYVVLRGMELGARSTEGEAELYCQTNYM